MMPSQSSDIKTIIVTGIEKIHDLQQREEQQFVQALQKGRVKLTLDNGTVLSIRPAKELNTINDLLKQIQEQTVVFAVSTSDKKEYFISDASQQSLLENKISKKGKEKVFTLLDDETKNVIAERIAELLTATTEKIAEHKESKKDVAAPTSAKPVAATAKTSQTETPQEVTTETATPQAIDSTVIDEKQKADDPADLEEQHLKQDAEREKEVQAAEKKQIIEETEEKRQELRVEQQTQTDQAGDKGSFNEELLKPASSSEISSDTPTKPSEAS